VWSEVVEGVGRRSREEEEEEEEERGSATLRLVVYRTKLSQEEETLNCSIGK
jgi:hypothetical protein